MVVYLMIIVMFSMNAFICQSGISKILSQLVLAESTVIDYNLYFWTIFREFVQTCEGIRNSMIARTVDALTLSPNSNLKSSI